MHGRSTRISFRQLAQVRCEGLQQWLRDVRPASTNNVVHEARRELKKLRALLRLMRPHWEEEAFRAENAALRDAGRRLAPLRDAWVHLTLIESLAQERKGDAVSRALELAIDRFRERYDETLRGHSPERLFPEVAEAVKAAAQRAANWPEPDADPFAWCAGGYRESYRRGRSRLAWALSHPSAVNLHELRKSSKDLRYQLEFLAAANRRPFGRIVASLHKLTDFLGKNHDLAVLRESLQALMAEALSHRQLLALHESLEAQHRASLDGALTLGVRFFAAKPKRFAERLEQAWEGALAASPRKTGSRASGSRGSS